MEYYVLNDIELSFKDVLKRSLGGEPLVDKKLMAEWEEKHKARKQNGAVENMEEGEDEEDEQADKKKKPEAEQNGDEDTEDKKKENGEPEKMDVNENGEEEGEEAEKPAVAVVKPVDTEKLRLEKARAVEKASILAPQLNLQQIEAAIAKGGGMGYDQEMINDLMAQTYAASVRWPKDAVLMVRLQHIVAALEADKWPVAENVSLLESVVENGNSGSETPEVQANNNANAAAARDTSTPLSEVTKRFRKQEI